MKTHVSVRVCAWSCVGASAGSPPSGADRKARSGNLVGARRLL